MKRYVVYRAFGDPYQGATEKPFACTEAMSAFEAACNVAGFFIHILPSCSTRWGMDNGQHTQFTIITLPTDDDDCAAWMMNQRREVRFISSQELAGFPEFVTETINLGSLAVEQGLMFSSSLEQLFEEDEE